MLCFDHAGALSGLVHRRDGSTRVFRGYGVRHHLVLTRSKAELIFRGNGESNPLAPTAQNVHQPQDRRVEIILR